MTRHSRDVLENCSFLQQNVLNINLTFCMNLALLIVGFNSVSDSDTYSEALRAINQMLLELQHLGRVWTVLPSNVYYKSMGRYTCALPLSTYISQF